MFYRLSFQCKDIAFCDDSRPLLQSMKVHYSLAAGSTCPHRATAEGTRTPREEVEVARITAVNSYDDQEGDDQ